MSLRLLCNRVCNGRNRTITRLLFAARRNESTSTGESPESLEDRMDGSSSRRREDAAPSLALVVGNGYRGQSKCVAYTTEKSGVVVFNCGEGTKRSGMVLKYGFLRKLRHFLITYKSWENMAGLWNCCYKFRVGGITKQRYCIHGPPGVERLVSHIYDSKFDVCRLDKGSFDDGDVNIEYVQLKVENSIHSDSLGNDAAANSAAEKSKTDVSVVYIWKLPAASGNPDKQKLKEVLGVPYLNSIIRAWRLGHKSITLHDGRQIQLEDFVKHMSETAFVVLEVPNEQFLEPLMSNPRLKELAELNTGVIVHMSPHSIVNHPTYQEFIKRFSGGVKHMFINQTSAGVFCEPAYWLQALLNMVDPPTYPLLPIPTGLESIHESPDSRFNAPVGCHYTIRPQEVKWDYDLKENMEKVIKLAMSNKNFPTELKEFQKKMKALPNRTGKQEYPEVVFLGTGSSQSGTLRSASCILVHTSPDTTIVLDCGDGSVGQIIRFYGDEADDVLRKIKMVFISHMHTDHYVGLPSLMEQQARAFRQAAVPYEKLCVVFPWCLTDFFNFYEKYFSQDFYGAIHAIPIEKMMDNKMDKDFVAKFGFKLSPVEVVHIRNSYGAVIKHNSGWNLVYSGDTMPSENLIKAGYNCDLLIHEATSDSLDDLTAYRKKHSTTKQAVAVARAMRAKFTMLTHFSLSTDMLSRLIPNDTDLPSNVGIAFDNMRITPSDFKRIPLHLKPLRVLLADQELNSFMRHKKL